MGSEMVHAGAVRGAVLQYGKVEGRGWGVCGVISVMAAGVVLFMPLLMRLYYLVLQLILAREGGWDSSAGRDVMVTIVPAVVIVCVPVGGLSFGVANMAAGFKMQAMVVGGMVVNMSGLIAGIAVLAGAR